MKQDKTLDTQIEAAAALALAELGETPPIPEGLHAAVDYGHIWEVANHNNLDLAVIHALAVRLAEEDGVGQPPNGKHYRFAVNALLFRRHDALAAYRALAYNAQQALAKELLGAA